ncbi:MAG: signal recognition particle-docking protein FtsY [Deltaproteobacteria bacterium]|nr:signal recognition particle-docking protein FtsY [Deltaproteobacteria bacterium]
MIKWRKRSGKKDKKTENTEPEHEDNSPDQERELEESEQIEPDPEAKDTPEPDSEDVLESESVPEEQPALAEPDEDLPENNKKGGFIERLKARLAGTRSVLTTRIDHLILNIKEIDEDVLDDLEEILITSDLGVATTQALLDTIGSKVARQELDSPQGLKEVLREEIVNILDLPPYEPEPGAKPHIILVIGVNGVGKTTTIAKLARRYKQSGKKVMLVAADTFRAAAVEQLTIWSERVGVDIVKQQAGADPSAVVFDAIHAARARDIGIVLIDTAGRLHTQVNLMDELKKVKRIAGREMPGAPHETLLVLDATTGQNAVNQAKLFNEAVEVSHLAMTKLDGSSKGGILVAIAKELRLPIRYIGLGEQMDDLKDFKAAEFVEALFD